MVFGEVKQWPTLLVRENIFGLLQCNFMLSSQEYGSILHLSNSLII